MTPAEYHAASAQLKSSFIFTRENGEMSTSDDDSSDASSISAASEAEVFCSGTPVPRATGSVYPTPAVPTRAEFAKSATRSLGAARAALLSTAP